MTASLGYPSVSSLCILNPKKSSVFCSWSEKGRLNSLSFSSTVGRNISAELPSRHHIYHNAKICTDAPPFSSQYSKVILVLSLFESFSSHRVWPTQTSLHHYKHPLAHSDNWFLRPDKPAGDPRLTGRHFAAFCSTSRPMWQTDGQNSTSRPLKLDKCNIQWSG